MDNTNSNNSTSWDKYVKNPFNSIFGRSNNSAAYELVPTGEDPQTEVQPPNDNESVQSDPQRDSTQHSTTEETPLLDNQERVSGVQPPSEASSVIETRRPRRRKREIPWREDIFGPNITDKTNDQILSNRLRVMAKAAAEADVNKDYKWSESVPRCFRSDAAQKKMEAEKKIKIKDETERKWMISLKKNITKLSKRAIAQSSKKDEQIVQKIFGCAHRHLEEYLEDLGKTGKDTWTTWTYAKDLKNLDAQKMAEEMNAAICDVLTLYNLRLDHADVFQQEGQNQGRLPRNTILGLYQSLVLFPQDVRAFYLLDPEMQQSFWEIQKQYENPPKKWKKKDIKKWNKGMMRTEVDFFAEAWKYSSESLKSHFFYYGRNDLVKQQKDIKVAESLRDYAIELSDFHKTQVFKKVDQSGPRDTHLAIFFDEKRTQGLHFRPNPSKPLTPEMTYREMLNTLDLPSLAIGLFIYCGDYLGGVEEHLKKGEFMSDKQWIAFRTGSQQTTKESQPESSEPTKVETKKNPKELSPITKTQDDNASQSDRSIRSNKSNKQSETDRYASDDSEVDEEREKLVKALEGLISSLTTDPNNIADLSRLGLVTEGLGQLGDAARTYARILEIDPNNADALLAKDRFPGQQGESTSAQDSQNDVDREKLVGALKGLIRRLATDPSKEDLPGLALVYEGLYKFGDALDTYGRILETDPNNAWASQRRKHILKLEKELKKWNNEQDSDNEQDNEQDSDNDFGSDKGFDSDKSFDSDKEYNYKGIYYSFHEVLKAGNKDQVKEIVADLISFTEKKPNDALSFIYLGCAYRRLRELDKSLEAYTRAIEANPRISGFYHGRGRLYASLGRLDEAIADFNQALEIAPDDWTVYQEKEHLLKRRGEATSTRMKKDDDAAIDAHLNSLLRKDFDKLFPSDEEDDLDKK